MLRQSCTNLLKLPRNDVVKWLSGIEAVICDADGVLWHFENAIEGAVDAFNCIKSTGRKAYVVTNNSASLTDVLIEKAKTFGYDIESDHMFTSASSIATYLATKKFQKKAYVVGERGIRDELVKAGICAFSVKPEKLDKPVQEIAMEMQFDPDVGAVCVGKDDHFTVPTIIRACTYLQNPKVLFLGTCMDAAYPIENNRLLIGAAAMIAAIKIISGRKPLILGKPNPIMASTGHFNPEKTLMIGDTLKTDILFAHNSGFHSLFVGTGVNSLKDVEVLRNSDDKRMQSMIPDAYLPSLGHLVQFLH